MAVVCWVLLLALSCNIWIQGITTTTSSSSSSSSNHHRSGEASEPKMASALSVVRDGILPVAAVVHPARESSRADDGTGAGLTPTTDAHQAQIPLVGYGQILHLLQPLHQQDLALSRQRVGASPYMNKEIQDEDEEDAAGMESTPRVSFLKRRNEEDFSTDWINSTPEMTGNGDRFLPLASPQGDDGGETWYPGSDDSLEYYPQHQASGDQPGELSVSVAAGQRGKRTKLSRFSEVTREVACLPAIAGILRSRNRSDTHDCSCTTRSYHMSMTCILRADDKERKENRTLGELLTFLSDRRLLMTFHSPVEVVLTHHCLQSNAICREVMCDCNIGDLLTKAYRSRDCLQNCSAACNSTAVSLYMRPVPHCNIPHCTRQPRGQRPEECDRSYLVFL